MTHFEQGAIIDNYQIAGILGSGGMGQVYRVEHILTRRQDAMKVLAGGRQAAGGQAQRFLREIQLQASLNHPNIAAVHHAFWMDDDLVMIMELVEGETLQSVLQAGRPSLATALNYAKQVLLALQYAHEHGVVHRDVTPANILIAAGGVIKLTDFGLAKAPRDMRLTQSGAVLGSLYYMSPEQVRGSATLDERTDIYSLGAVLYEMSTGKRPFEAGDPFSLMLAHVQQPPLWGYRHRLAEINGQIAELRARLGTAAGPVGTSKRRTIKKRWRQSSKPRFLRRSQSRTMHGTCQLLDSLLF